ncbi:MAG: hypothetical protein RQ899_07575 [Pseudomonadales bacterium]|nr:hypothetical protein [Pseudomonadales bacterium]
MNAMKNLLKIITVMTALGMLTACYSSRLNQFNDFASAGKSYSSAMVALTKEVGNLAIDADSVVLLEIRDTDTDIDTRIKNYKNHTKSLQDFLTELQRIRQHTLLLNKYFIALSALATTDLNTGIGAEASSLAAQMQALHPAIENASIGDAPIKDFIGGVVPMVVAAYKQKVLSTELKKNATVLERELELQSAALEALVDDYKSDVDILMARREISEVVDPYLAETSSIPEGWENARRAVLNASTGTEMAASAVQAAKELKKTFIALVAGKSGQQDFDVLFADINAILDLIESTKTERED